MIIGDLNSVTARRLIRKWALLHQADLEENWQNMKAGKPLEKIDPLT